ncbi:MAG: hypothetical protein P9L99_08705 [Candidatus Lernaella stagnicola]|nr:hypothetical protein [Candidatus Lernaella stagnicola]
MSGATTTHTNRQKWIAMALTAAVFLALVGFYFRTASHFYPKYWVDDAAISFTFARHLAEGYGSVAYPGGERVEGFSNPTWVGLLAVAHAFGADIFPWSQHLALACALLIFLLLIYYAKSPAPGDRSPWPVALAAFLLAGNAGFAIWNQSGMENALYGFLLTAGMMLVIREARDPDAKPWSAPVLVLLAITRPEAVAHLGIAGLFLLVSDLFEHRRPTRRFFLWVGAAAGLFAAYHVWHYIYYARPFPNTYYAKVRPGVAEHLFSLRSRGWKYVFTYLQAYGYTPLLVLTLPAFARRRLWREATYFALTGMFLLFFPIYANGDWMKSWRFLSNFPIPLALLLGLAAFNMAYWVRKPASRFLSAKWATVAVTILAVLWTVVPIALIDGGSRAELALFLDDREVSAKGIARRVRWWNGIAKKVAVRPHDALMTDMDMGGTTYNWDGRIMDIGYLLSVPMATHRYTPQWRAMMNEHYFREMRPEFIHQRRGWGRATTIPTNPKFKKQYLQLPDDRRFSRSFPNGNFVRRDLFEFDRLPEQRFATALKFPGGLRLHNIEVPEAVYPRSKVPLFLWWSRGEEAPPKCEFAIGRARPGEEPRMKDHKALMGWLPTSSWPEDKFLREVVWFETPRSEYNFEMVVAVQCRGHETVVEKVPVSLNVNRRSADKRVESLVGQAMEAAKQNAVTADRAPLPLRRAEYIAGEKRLAKQRRAVEKQRQKTYLKVAAQAFGETNYEAAALALAKCRRLEPRDDRYRNLAWQTAKKLYETGRAHQLREEYDEAYAAFDLACKAQPQHAWARRRAEEVRMKRD